MRRRKTGLDMNLDSLLDTMTNVVGILVILLAVTQLGVGEAVKQVTGRGDIPEITDEVLAIEQKELEKLNDQLADIKEEYNLKNLNLEKMRIDLKRFKQIREELNRLPPLDRSLDYRQLDKDVVALKKRIDDLQKEIARLKDVIEEKDALLAQRYREGPKVRDMTIPVITIASSGLEPVYFVCRKGRIYPYNRDKLSEQLVSSAKTVTKKRGKRLELTSDDFKRLAKYLERNNIGDKYFQLRIDHSIGFPMLRMEPRRKDQGDTMQQLRDSNSVFVKALNSINPKKQFVKYLVWNDSFETYLTAKDTAKQKIPSLRGTWIPYSETESLSYTFFGGGGERREVIQY
jgi:DNA repair exonuclease SbcCD ATPase subunit